MLPYLLLMVGCILLDQLTKIFARIFLSGVQTVPLIPGVLHLTYSLNTGAAFSLFSGMNAVLLVFSFVITAGIGFALYSLPKHQGFRNLNVALSLIMGGAIGNLIDRLFAGAVTDFIDFRLIGFPIFNVADICVVIGAILAVLYFIRGYVNVPRMTDIRKNASSSDTPKTKPAIGSKVISTFKKHPKQNASAKTQKSVQKRPATKQTHPKTPPAQREHGKKDNRIKWNPPSKPE